MQFIVFVAFAAVLTIPAAGPPWPHLEGAAWAWSLAGLQVLAPAAAAAMTRSGVIRRLERNPTRLPDAQRRFARGQAVMRGALLAGLGVHLYATNWAVMVRRWPAANVFYGIDELVILGPFFLAMVIGWILLYPADRAIRQVSLERCLWAAAPARPVWHAGSYLSFMLRHHVLIVVLPMTPIIMANDFIGIHAAVIRRATGLAWADQAVLVMLAGVVFFFAPVVLRYVWHTRPLPHGDLRRRLDELCARVGLTYRQILVWQSDGMVVNAAVMGIVRPVRYVLLSDGLLETMEDRKIEAVFGHEAGHVVHRHMLYFMFFAVLSMLVVGGAAELAYRLRPEMFRDEAGGLGGYLQVGAMGLIVLLWLVGFGFVSRRFEWQADLFGVRCLSDSEGPCDLPCAYHGNPGPTEPSAVGHPRRPAGVCTAAAMLFAETLQAIAALNGIPIEARSWRHSSIAHRVRRLQDYAADPQACLRLEREVLLIKSVLAVGTIVGLVIGLWLYWPTPS